MRYAAYQFTRMVSSSTIMASPSGKVQLRKAAGQSSLSPASISPTTQIHSDGSIPSNASVIATPSQLAPLAGPSSEYVTDTSPSSSSSLTPILLQPTSSTSSESLCTSVATVQPSGVPTPEELRKAALDYVLERVRVILPQFANESIAQMGESMSLLESIAKDLEWRVTRVTHTKSKKRVIRKGDQMITEEQETTEVVTTREVMVDEEDDVKIKEAVVVIANGMARLNNGNNCNEVRDNGTDPSLLACLEIKDGLKSNGRMPPRNQSMNEERSDQRQDLTIKEAKQSKRTAGNEASEPDLQSSSGQAVQELSTPSADTLRVSAVNLRRNRAQVAKPNELNGVSRVGEMPSALSENDHRIRRHTFESGRIHASQALPQFFRCIMSLKRPLKVNALSLIRSAPREKPH